MAGLPPWPYGGGGQGLAAGVATADAHERAGAFLPPEWPLPPLTRGFEFECLMPFRWSVQAGYDTVPVPAGERWVIVDGCIVLNDQQYQPHGFTQEMVDFNKLDMGRHLCRAAVYEAMLTLGVAVHDPQMTYVHWGPPPDDVQAEDEDNPNHEWTLEPHYLRWSVKDDPSLTSNIDNLFRYRDGPHFVVDVEIVSPPLPDANPAADAQVVRVLTMLKNTFVIFTPDTCGLHIHIGQGKVMYDARAARNIAAMFFMVEHLYNTLHMEHRRVDELNHPSLRERTNASMGMTADQANDNTPGNLWDTWSLEDDWPKVPLFPGMINILGTDSVNAVQTMLMSPGRGAYNFKNIQYEYKPTIEFRQAAATFNEVWVIHWSHILAATVNLARRVDNGYFWRTVAPRFAMFDELNPQAMTIDEFLRQHLQLPEAADYIASTTPRTRHYPPDQQQATWRARPTIAPQIQPDMVL
ncbi:hypothetical protein BJ166DRAFT_606723 [Pestalotiopsis sp. NC0098]|nr:hypothetical protein BJ166DRAFT_606723 [Pestalotiopsis sp. NC0098]